MNEPKVQVEQVRLKYTQGSKALSVNNWEDVKEKNLWDYPYSAYVLFSCEKLNN